MMTSLLHLNEIVFHAFNSLAGRSWSFDTMISILESNPLIKGALVGACFASAWYVGRNNKELIRSRSTIFSLLLALIVTLVISKGLSHSIFFPRPYVMSEHLYHLEGDKLVEYKQVPYRVPLDNASQALYQRFRNGDISVNSLGAIPSDHAAFFLTIGLGLLLVERRLGMLALLWTLAIILPTKMISGRHYPMDVVIGTLVALFSILFVFHPSRRYLSRFFDPLAEWSLEHNKLAGAFIFIVAFEIASTLKNLYPIIDFVSTIARNLLHI